MIARPLLTAILCLVTAPALAGGWSCRNEAVEVSCADGACTVAEAHTPMDVSMTDGGAMTVCAYSGCWEGQASALLTTARHTFMAGEDLRWNASPDQPGEAAAVTLDRTTLAATVLVAGYVNPLTCTATD